jgi:hypothetical protein
MKGMKSDDEAAAPPAAQPPAPPALRPGQPTEADNGQGAPNRSEHTS